MILDKVLEKCFFENLYSFICFISDEEVFEIGKVSFLKEVENFFVSFFVKE